jgi:hypothetical protein
MRIVLASRQKLGVGSPLAVSIEPSVPPRMIVIFGVRPSDFHGIDCFGDGPRFLHQTFAHVAVLLAHFHDISALRVGMFCSQVWRRLIPTTEPGGPGWAVSEVAQDQPSAGFGDAPFDVIGVNEAFTTIRRFR